MQRPLFNWAGSKADHLVRILKHIPLNTTRFVDVFGGSGVVILNTPFHELDVYNDLNSNVVNFFKIVRDREEMEEFIYRLELHAYSREQFDEYADYENITDHIDRAVAWYYRIVCSFSGLGRHFGRSMRNSYDMKRVYERIPEFEQVHLRIRHCLIENKNAFDLAREFDDPKTVFYMDPPYVDTDHGTYKGPKFTVDDHKALLCLIDDLKGKVILSGSPCEFYDECDIWSHKESWPVKSKLDLRDRSKGRVECLWVKL